ncbi:S8 family serine peptidase [Actinosynnema sp. NPDC050436]|uniref:S8 family serine peptidase n=1 Tax=Actinosynnema sp. NPDC050436 TaxID=3155659 RepID=UPI0033F60BCA
MDTGRSRPRRARTSALLVTAVVTAASLVAPPAGAQPAAGQPAAGQPAPPSVVGRHTITLVTGDRVELSTLSDGRQGAAFSAAPGRESVGYTSRSVDGRFLVVPDDVAPLVAADRVDEGLFDLTALVAEGYDDQRSPQLPLIVQYDPASVRAEAVSAPTGATDRFVLESINARSVSQDRARATAFWSEVTASGAVRKVWLNRKFRTVLDHSVPQVGAPQAWAGGFDGTGVTVAVVDTGIDRAHPDLDGGKVVAEANFSADPDTTDRNGHGTHVASTVAGTGEATPVVRKGVAPGASLLNAKALDKDGEGGADGVINALEWAVEQGADVVNMSLGGLFPAEGPDPISLAVDSVSRSSGALVVVAAGNLGEQGERTITSPGYADEALTVGAVDREDELAEFSSQGPRRGDLAVKPDLTAPGVDIAAARADGTARGPIVDDRYQRLSGTSMATPHVAGAAAILAQQHPGYTGTALKDALISTARTGPGHSAYQVGGGRLDVARAHGQRVHAAPGTLNLGYLSWPHPGPVTRTVTYTNATAAEVTLRLSLELTHQDGSTPPAGMVTVDRAQVAVPANGTASVTLTLDPAAGASGRFGGYLHAVGGDIAVHTSIGTYVERELHEVAVTAIPHSGTLDWSSRVVLWSPAGGHVEQYVSAGSPTATFRVPPGTYTAVGFLETADASGEKVVETTFVSDPEFEVSGATSLTLDGRTANEIVVNTELPTATSAVTLSYYRALGGRSDHMTASKTHAVRAFAAPTETVTEGEFEFFSKWDLTTPPDGQGTPPSYEYDLLLPEKQRVPASLTYRADRGNTAILDTWYLADEPGTEGRDMRYAFRPYSSRVVDRQRDVPRPLHRTYFVSAADDTSWQHQVWSGPAAEGRFTGPVTTYRPGTAQREEWLRRPARPGAVPSAAPSTRTDDTFRFSVAPYADPEGNGNSTDFDDVHLAELEADGVPLFRLDRHPTPDNAVPAVPTPATYRLTYRNERTKPWWNYSTRTETTWTFRSSRPQPGRTDRVPLVQADYRPALDDYNRAPAGSYGFPVHVGHVPGVAGPPITEVRGRASTDDGRTWTPMPLLDLGGGNYVAQVVNPPSGAVSLHLTATDGDGNALDQTIIRAYGVAGS